MRHTHPLMNRRNALESSQAPEYRHSLPQAVNELTSPAALTWLPIYERALVARLYFTVLPIRRGARNAEPYHAFRSSASLNDTTTGNRAVTAATRLQLSYAV